jgi:arylsulfatase A-like enzyme
VNVPSARRVLLLAALAGCGGEAPSPDLGPPTVHEEVALDIIEAFAAGATAVRIVAQDSDKPLAAMPFSLDKGLTLGVDAGHKVIHARAESAFEVRLPALPSGARLQARTFVYSVFRNDPERADPAPVTYRILVDGVEQASLSSDYIAHPGDRKHPYDILLRSLELLLPAGRECTLRFETTRAGVPVPPGVVPSEPLWWDLRVLQPVRVPRQASGPGAPNLLVLVVDTLAARRMSLLGYARPTTPSLQAFAAQGTSFEHALSPSSWTLPATATLLTGLPPNAHGVLGDERSYLMDGLLTWPERLQRAGLSGAAFVANPLVAQANNFPQGFDVWEQADAGGHGETADQLDARFLAWLDGQPRGARWFAYVHYMDPHAPYAAPGDARLKFGQGFAEQRDFRTLLPNQLQRGEVPPLALDEQAHVVDLYDAEVAWFDECLGRLLAQLQQRGQLANTVVALTADHGEELFEHGQLGHGYTLYEELLHVPLVLVGPGVPAARVGTPVGTQGFAATLLDLMRVPAPDLPRGLLPLSNAAPAPVFSTVRTQLFGPRHVLNGAQDGQGRKVLLVHDEHGAVVEVQRFDLRKDPREQAPLDPSVLSADEQAAYDALAEAVAAWALRTSEQRLPEEQPVDPDIDRRAEQIGYLEGKAGQ